MVNTRGKQTAVEEAEPAARRSTRAVKKEPLADLTNDMESTEKVALKAKPSVRGRQKKVVDEETVVQEVEAPVISVPAVGNMETEEAPVTVDDNSEQLGRYWKFDDNGEPTLAEAKQRMILTTNYEVEQQYDETEYTEEEEAVEETEQEESSEASTSMWEMRDPQKSAVSQWNGTHIKFTDEVDEQEPAAQEEVQVAPVQDPRTLYLLVPCPGSGVPHIASEQGPGASTIPSRMFGHKISCKGCGAVTRIPQIPADIDSLVSVLTTSLNL